MRDKITVVGNRLEREIIGVFNRDICAFFSINQISKKLKRAYPHINSKVNGLIKEGVLKKLQVGRSFQCSVNLSSEKAVALLILTNIDKKEISLSKNRGQGSLVKDINAIKKEFRVHTVMLSGDTVIFVLDYLHDKEAIKSLFPSLKANKLLFFDRESFKSHIIECPWLANEPVILYSYEKYYEIIAEIEDRLVGSKLISASVRGDAR